MENFEQYYINEQTDFFAYMIDSNMLRIQRHAMTMFPDFVMSHSSLD